MGSHVDRWPATKDSIKACIPRTPQALLSLVSNMILIDSYRLSRKSHSLQRTEKKGTGKSIRVKQAQTFKQLQVGPGEHTGRAPQKS